MKAFIEKITSCMTIRNPAYLYGAWTFFILLSAAWGLYEIREHTNKEALIEARTYYELNLYYRKWVAETGGVYAHSDTVSPNPYLLDPHRDITAEGEKLTLVNPAYMTRMVFALLAKHSASPVVSRLISLRPLNPANSPDETEKKALIAFERGRKEVSESTLINGAPYMKVIRPFITETSCLKCHGTQGYKVGDVRGGISIAVPLSPYYEAESGMRVLIFLSHIVMWLTGIAGLVVFIRKKQTNERQLAESEWKFRTLSEFATDWVFWVNCESRIMYTSPSCADITGYTDKEFAEDPGLIAKIIHPDCRELWNDHLKHFEAAAQHEAMDIHIVTKYGEDRWLSHVCGPIYLEDRFLGRRASNRDITERKRVEEKLRESEHFLQTIIETEPECVKILTSDGTLQMMNRSGLAMIEADSIEQVRGKSMYHLVSPEYRHAFEGLTEQIFRGETGSLEFEMTGLKGRRIFLSTNAVPLRNNKNEVIALLGITRDITDQKRTQAALQESEALLKNILESVGEGFLAIDHEYRIISANKAYTESAQRNIEEVVGRHCYEISHHYDRPCMEFGEECPVMRTFETGEPVKVIHIHNEKGGNPAYVEVKSYPLKDAEGNIVSVIEAISDITSQRKLEEQLRQAQKLEAVGQLAGGIAHDFNNILTAVMGYGNLMQIKMRKDDPLQEDVGHILGAAVRAANLTKSLLAYSRKQVIEPHPTDLNGVVRKVEKLLSRLIGEDIELRTVLTDKDVTVMADSLQIEQVLMNLATNARDAMPNGGLLVIETGRTVFVEDLMKSMPYIKPGGYAVFSVRDTGKGMDEKTKEKIFEPFFTTKEVGKGTGLGLAVAYGIVRQHEGFIKVESEEGKGTTFTIYLPAISTVLEEASSAEDVSVRGGSETILLAEDDAVIRELIKNILEKFGYKVIIAEDGEDAVNKFKTNRDRIHLLLFDVLMPRKNGKEAYLEILKHNPDMRALFLSGYTADIIQERGLLEDGLTLIRKPISVNDLLNKIRCTLDEGT